MPTDVEETVLVDDFSQARHASNGCQWRYFSDTVMGGVSRGEVRQLILEGRAALQLSGTISFENNGGFIQAALDLGTDNGELDASAATGIVVCLKGDGGTYAINLRTGDTQRPWQSYRRPVVTGEHWQTCYLPFREFVAHRIERPLDSKRLRRVGLIAIGEAGPACVAISRLAFYKQTTP